MCEGATRLRFPCLFDHWIGEDRRYNCAKIGSEAARDAAACRPGPGKPRCKCFEAVACDAAAWWQFDDGCRVG